jgi:hypothetical protein
VNSNGVFPTSDLTQRRKAAKTARQTLFILCALAPLRLCVNSPVGAGGGGAGAGLLNNEATKEQSFARFVALLLT